MQPIQWLRQLRHSCVEAAAASAVVLYRPQPAPAIFLVVVFKKSHPSPAPVQRFLSAPGHLRMFSKAAHEPVWLEKLRTFFVSFLPIPFNVYKGNLLLFFFLFIIVQPVSLSLLSQFYFFYYVLLFSSFIYMCVSVDCAKAEK